MQAEEFNRYVELIAGSRRKFCDQLGISRRTGDAYALGRAPIPRTIALAIAALDAGLPPAGSMPAAKKIDSGLTASS